MPTIRRELHAGDLDAVVAHHGRVYGEGYGVDGDFERHVAAAASRAVSRGFPAEREAIWLVKVDGEHAGSLALTDEGDDSGAIRWFVLDPDLRGRGLGRRLLDDLLSTAVEYGYRRLWLETFSELEAAGHLYREHGFRVVSTDTGPRWGKERISYQRYELELPPASLCGSRMRPLNASATAAIAIRARP